MHLFLNTDVCKKYFHRTQVVDMPSHVNKPCHAPRVLSLDAWGHTILSHSAERLVQPGMWAVDATAGNGHDTVFLARCLGIQGRVWAFDVQKNALAATAARLKIAEAEGHALAPVTFLHMGHEHMMEIVPAGIHVVVFNLGYLPGSDKSLATQLSTTLDAFKQAQQLLCVGGCIWVHAYTGHPGGKDECMALLEAARALPYETWQVLHAETLNKQCRPEHVLLLQKRRAA